MNLKLELEFSKADILKEVDALKKQIDDMRPLPADVEGRVMQKLRLDWNYNSNAIEGNKLSYGETVAFLMEGITAKGKPLKDHLDIRGHNEAINFLLEIVKDSRSISEADIRALHKMILVEPYDSPAKTAEGLPTTKRINLGEYKTSANHVKTATGEIHYYATPQETPAKMQELMEWYEEVKNHNEINPIVIAALFHHKFVEIHPFDDGNGRLSRILMNLILMQNGYAPVVIKMDDRKNYYSLLSRADNNDSWAFVEYIAELLENSLQMYLKAIHGGDIDEDEDIEKEASLIKIQLKGGSVDTIKKNNDVLISIFLTEVLPLSFLLVDKIKEFTDYFFSSKNLIRIHYYNGSYKSSWSASIHEDDMPLINNFIENKRIDFIILELNLNEYKNPENSFSVKITFKISFEIFYYKVYLENKDILVSKLYSEGLSKLDKNKILKGLMQDFKHQLSQKQKSSKP